MKNPFTTILAACCCLVSLSAGGDKPTVSTWEKFDEADGIAVFRKDMPDSPIVALRGEGVVNAPILRVASVIVDVSRETEWIDSLVEARIISSPSLSEYVEWNHVKTPFVLKDRDFVAKSRIEFRPQEKVIVINYHSVQDPGAPKTSYVRGEFKYGLFVMTSIEHGTKKTRVLAELMCDPKGSVAKWLVNLFQKSWPHNTIVALRNQTQKLDIRDNARLRDAMGDAYR